MIDLTNQNHKRGVVILTSKDVRTVDKYSFDYLCNLNCVETTLVILKSRISKLEIDESIKDATLSDIDFMLNNITQANGNINRVRDVFR